VEGPVGTVSRRVAGKDVTVALTAKRAANAWDGPLVVLVNHQTLGAAEMLAGALANKGRATLVGGRTFGDGMEQSILVLKDGSSLVMTTGKLVTSGGQAYQAKGISPGISVASAAEQMPEALRVLARAGS
jgi:carboxyl-terminal processing protease